MTETHPADDRLLQQIDGLHYNAQVEKALGLALRALGSGDQRMGLGLRAVELLLATGHYADADAAAVASTRFRAATPVEILALAKRLVYFNRGGALQQLGLASLRAPGSDAVVDSDLAAMLSMIGDQDTAKLLMLRASRSRPGHGMLYNLSQMHAYHGRFEEAEDALRDLLQLEPGNAKAHWALSKLPGAVGDAAALVRLDGLARASAPGHPDTPFLWFGLFNHLDARDEAERAWHALSRGCESKRLQLNWAPDEGDALIRALSDAGVPGTRTGPSGSPRPLFVVGMHRSGTTLLELLLGNHPDVAQGGELYDFPSELRLAHGRHFAGACDLGLARAAGALDLATVGRQYRARVAWRAGGKRVLVDKLPSNFLNAGMIAAALPDATIVHMRRDPLDTCFSNLKELFSGAAPYSYDQHELARWFLGYRDLMDRWRELLGERLVEVDYESLASAPAETAAAAFAACGLGWSDAWVDTSSAKAVNTASSAQVRQPIHTRSIGGWRRYERWLQPLADALQR